MGEVQSSAQATDQPSMRETYFRRRESGSWRTNAAVGGLAAALVVGSPFALYKYGEMNAAKANYAQANPNGLLNLPSWSDTDSRMPSLDVGAEVGASIDMDEVIDSIRLDVESVKFTTRIPLQDVSVATTVDTATKYEVTPEVSGTLPFVGKEVTVQSPLAIPFEVKKQFEGDIELQYYIPPEAVNGVTINGNTMVIADLSLMQMKGFQNGSETLRPYTVGKDGEPDFEDQTGYLESFIKGNAHFQAFIGKDELINKLNTYEENSRTHLTDEIVRITTEACADSDTLNSLVENRVAEAITDVGEEFFGLDPDDITVKTKGKVSILTNFEIEATENEGKAVAAPAPDTNIAVEEFTSEEIQSQVDCSDDDFEIIGGQNE